MARGTPKPLKIRRSAYAQPARPAMARSGAKPGPEKKASSPRPPRKPDRPRPERPGPRKSSNRKKVIPLILGIFLLVCMGIAFIMWAHSIPQEEEIPAPTQYRATLSMAPSPEPSPTATPTPSPTPESGVSSPLESPEGTE